MRNTNSKLPIKGVDFKTHAFDIDMDDLQLLKDIVFTMKKRGRVSTTQRDVLHQAMVAIKQKLSASGVEIETEGDLQKEKSRLIGQRISESKTKSQPGGQVPNKKTADISWWPEI